MNPDYMTRCKQPHRLPRSNHNMAAMTDPFCHTWPSCRPTAFPAGGGGWCGGICHASRRMGGGQAKKKSTSRHFFGGSKAVEFFLCQENQPIHGKWEKYCKNTAILEERQFWKLGDKKLWWFPGQLATKNLDRAWVWLQRWLPMDP